jgi:hypothetical protein
MEGQLYSSLASRANADAQAAVHWLRRVCVHTCGVPSPASGSGSGSAAAAAAADSASASASASAYGPRGSGDGSRGKPDERCVRGAPSSRGSCHYVLIFI